jgi:hypothetical protein
MKQFRGPTTVFTVLEPLKWQETSNNLSLPPGSYAAVPELVRDEINGIDNLLQWIVKTSDDREYLMGASQAYYFARDGLLRVEGWSTEQLRR